jgi:hypothetical protein
MVFELARASGGETVVLGAAIILGGSPLGLQFAVLLQPGRAMGTTIRD